MERYLHGLCLGCIRVPLVQCHSSFQSRRWRDIYTVFVEETTSVQFDPNMPVSLYKKYETLYTAVLTNLVYLNLVRIL